MYVRTYIHSCPAVGLICVRVSDAVVSGEHDFLYFCRPTVTHFKVSLWHSTVEHIDFNLKFKISTKQPFEMSHPVSLKIHFYILASTLRSPQCCYPLILSSSVSSIFLFCYIPVLPISLRFNCLSNIWWSVQILNMPFNSLHPPANSHAIRSNIVLGILFWRIINLCPSLRVRDHFSHYCNTTSSSVLFGRTFQSSSEDFVFRTTRHYVMGHYVVWYWWCWTVRFCSHIGNLSVVSVSIIYII